MKSSGFGPIGRVYIRELGDDGKPFRGSLTSGCFESSCSDLSTLVNNEIEHVRITPAETALRLEGFPSRILRETRCKVPEEEDLRVYVCRRNARRPGLCLGASNRGCTNSEEIRTVPSNTKAISSTKFKLNFEPSEPYIIAFGKRHTHHRCVTRGRSRTHRKPRRSA